MVKSVPLDWLESAVYRCAHAFCVRDRNSMKWDEHTTSCIGICMVGDTIAAFMYCETRVLVNEMSYEPLVSTNIPTDRQINSHAIRSIHLRIWFTKTLWNDLLNCHWTKYDAWKGNRKCAKPKHEAHDDGAQCVCCVKHIEHSSRTIWCANEFAFRAHNQFHLWIQLSNSWLLSEIKHIYYFFSSHMQIT